MTMIANSSAAVMNKTHSMIFCAGLMITGVMWVIVRVLLAGRRKSLAPVDAARRAGIMTGRDNQFLELI